MFIKNCIIDRYTDKNKNRQCITSGIKHWGLSGYSSVLPRIKFGVTGQVCSPQSPTISYRRPLAFIVKRQKYQTNQVHFIYSNILLEVRIFNPKQCYIKWLPINPHRLKNNSRGSCHDQPLLPQILSRLRSFIKQKLIFAKN